MSYLQKIDQILEKYNQNNENIKYHIEMFEDYDYDNYYDICILYVWDVNSKRIHHYYKDLNDMDYKDFIYCGDYDELEFFTDKNGLNEYNVCEKEFIYK